MKNRIALAVGLALTLAIPAFAQAQDNQQAAAGSQSTDPGSQAPAARVRHHRARSSETPTYSPAAMAVNGDDPKYAAYQASDRQKSYPAVDHGHVPGDPPVIDHNGDQAPVADPTHTAITVPPTH